MSLPFLTRRERVTVTTYSRVFDWAERPGSGFAFDCTASGSPLPMADAAWRNWQECTDGTFDVIDRGVQTYQHTYTEPASVRCDCYATVWLEDLMFNECSRCGLGINGSGQRLAPVAQWEPGDQYAVFGPAGEEQGS